MHFGVPPFPTAVREEACDGFVIGGGVRRVLGDGTLAGAFEKPFWLQLVGTGLTTALSAHLGAVLPFAQWPAVNCLNNYADDLLVEPLAIEGGFVQVPDRPGLGVDFDESAVMRHRMEPPFELPKEDHVLSVVWEGGRVVHYASLRQCWDDFRLGHNPVQERGVRMETWIDDGSKDFAELLAKATIAPVRAVR